MTRPAALLVALLAAVAAVAGARPAAGQVTGSVDSVGLAGWVRPDAWVPMLVKVTPTGGASANYRLVVRQLDLDGDAVLFERTIPVTGNAVGGGGRDQYFWTYFKPEPVGGPGGLAGEQDLARLNERLAVTLNRDDGGAAGEEVARLAVSNAPINTDGDATRGRRLVVFVGDRSPPLGGYDLATPQLEGVVEGLAPALIAARDLPDDVRGYDAADAVVLLGGAVDYDALLSGGRLDAIKAFVRRGGRLVVCQPTDQYQQVLRLGDLLPVAVTGVEEVKRPDALRSLALPREDALPAVYGRAWDALAGPFRVAVARAKEGTVVDAAQALPDGRRVPFLARHLYGTGSVSWLALDPTDPALRPTGRLGTRRPPVTGGGEDGGAPGTSYTLPGWPAAWSAILGYNDAPVVDPTKAQRAPYETLGYSTRDLGGSLLADMNLSARTTGYVALAVIFFLGYWAAAGPGLHFLLVAKGRASLSWYLFGAAAVAATLVTLVLVRLVLRGPPEARHLTLARAVGADNAEGLKTAPPAHEFSRIGLYVPRDGPQAIALPDAGATSTVTAFALHPSRLGDQPPVTGTSYAVEVVAPTAAAPAVTDVPYRSTLKKLAVTRVGPLEGRVTGTVTLRPGSARYVDALLKNDTGRDLRNCYLAFRHPQARGGQPGTFVVYLRGWASGDTVDLNALFGRGLEEFPYLNPESGITPRGNRPAIRGSLENDWVPYWYRALSAASSSNFGAGLGEFADFGEDVRASFPLLSLFGALPPMANNPQTPQPTRAELLRRGARDWDASAALRAGALLVIAESAGPLPFPMTVAGRPVGGEGTTVYQFVLPAARSGLE